MLRGERFFYQRRSGRLDQPVLVLRDGVAGVERVIVDPNALSARGIVALDWWYPADSGRLLAYGLSEGGTELSTLRVLDLDSGEHLPADVIPHTRAASIAWLPDDSGFYLTRLRCQAACRRVRRCTTAHVFFHPLGQDWRVDEEVLVPGARRGLARGHVVGQRPLAGGGDRPGLGAQRGLPPRSRTPERGFAAIHAGVDALAECVFRGRSALSAHQPGCAELCAVRSGTGARRARELAAGNRQSAPIACWTG